MQVDDQGIVAHSLPGTDAQSCAFPGVCLLPSGRWLVSYRAAPTKAGMQGQHPRVCWSDDEGATWSEPIRPFSPIRWGDVPGSFRTAHVTTLADGDLLAALCWVDDTDPYKPFFNEETEGLLDARICLSRSTDEGESWSTAEFVETGALNVPVPLTGPILHLGGQADRQRLAIQLETNKPYLDPQPWHHRSMLLHSSDSGRSWAEHVVTSDDPHRQIFYWDQRPAVLGEAELLNLFWTFDRVNGEYLNIHARRSENNGSDWSPLWDTGVPGQPAPAVRLADGQLVMVYVDRTTSPKIKLRTSTDNGLQWPLETELTLFAQETSKNLTQPGDMQTAWNEMYDYALGLPTTTLLPDDDVLVVFYAGASGDATGIQWLRLRSESAVGDVGSLSERRIKYPSD